MKAQRMLCTRAGMGMLRIPAFAPSLRQTLGGGVRGVRRGALRHIRLVELISRRHAARRPAAASAAIAGRADPFAIHNTWHLHGMGSAPARGYTHGLLTLRVDHRRSERLLLQRSGIASQGRESSRKEGRLEGAARAASGAVAAMFEHAPQGRHGLAHPSMVARAPGLVARPAAAVPAAAREPARPHGPDRWPLRGGASAMPLVLASARGEPAAPSPVVLRRRAAPSAPAEVALIARGFVRAIDLVWRPSAPASIDASRAASVDPSSAGAGGRDAVARAPVPQAGGATVVQRLDAGTADRLADEVIQRVERRLRIERERRGL